MTLKNRGIKLLKRNAGLVELPYESKPTPVLLPTCYVLVCLPETTGTAAGGEVSPLDLNRKS